VSNLCEACDTKSFQILRSRWVALGTLMSAMTQIPPQLAEAHGPSDGVLLRRFVQDADEVAFGQIVQRHASLVMSVCRRVVGQTADVDDAFQATFYALSQRPESIRECRSLSGWLYSVAWRTSVRLIRLRKKTKMETLPDQLPMSEPDPLDRIAEANDLAALDEELNQLPEKYRHVLVMSYFSQQTNQEIADQLNENKGAVDGRIREARRMLRVRLARRGVEIGALLVAGALAQSASAAVSPQLISTTMQFSKLSSGFSAANVTGVDLTQLQALSSTGTTVMGIKAGTFLATGVLMLTGAFGFSQLAARQDEGSGGSGASAISASVDEAAQQQSSQGTENAEVAATTSTATDSPTADLQIYTISLKFLSADYMAKTVEKLMDKSDPQIIVEPISTTNQLVIKGTEKQLEEITTLLSKLDVASDGTAGVAGSEGSSAGAAGGGSGMSSAVGSGGMSASGGGGEMGLGGGGGGGMVGSGMTGGMSAEASGPKASGAMGEFSRAGARKAQEKLHATVNSARVPSLDFGEGTPLRDILDALETHFSETNPPLSVSIRVDEGDGEIGQDATYLEQTQISEVNISAGSMTVASALDLILKKAHDQELTWIVENEVILITTTGSAERSDRAFIRSYDVKKLKPMFEEMAKAVPTVPVYTAEMGGGGGAGMGYFMVPQASPAAMTGAPAATTDSKTSETPVTLQQMGAGGMGGMGGGGMGSGVSPEPTMIKNTWQRCLINEIQSLTTPPCQWLVDGGEFGTMSVVGDRLIVQQSRSGHEKVVEVVEELELAVETP
jgi:RNA polymerase sigma factor (sigma-70 family)